MKEKRIVRIVPTNLSPLKLSVSRMIRWGYGYEAGDAPCAFGK